MKRNLYACLVCILLIVVFVFVTGISSIHAQVSTADATVRSVGTDLSTASSPAGISFKLDFSSDTAANPTSFLNISAGSHTTYATYLPNYAVSVGSCSYLRGGASECAVTNFANASCDNNFDICTYPFTATSNYITKVVWKYDMPVSSLTGDVMTKLVGTDLTTASAPVGIQSGIDTQSMVSTNPVTWASQTTGSHSIFTTYNPSYTTSVGTCTYSRGGSECAVTNFTQLASSFGNSACDTNTNLCRLDVTVSASTVTKVVWKYDSVSQGSYTGDIYVKNIGTDLTTTSAPSNIQTTIDAQSATLTNPSTWSLLSTGTHAVYTTYNSSYLTSVGTCTYARGGNECAVVNFTAISTGFGNQKCDTNTNLCRLDVTVSANTVTKVAWKYDTAGSVDPGSNGIQVYRVGADQTTGSALAGSQVKVGSVGVLTSTNPYFFGTSTNGTYSVYTTYNPSYTPTWGYCTYARGGTECTITYFNGYNMGYTSDAGNNICFTSAGGNFCRIDMTVTSNTITKLVLRSVPTSNGDLVVQRVGADQTVATAIPGTQTKIGSAGTLTTTNPLTIAATSTGTYSVYTTYNPSYTPTWGYCTYARGGTECTITYFNGYNMGYTSDAGNNICFTSAGGNFCRIDMTVGADTITKLVTRMIPIATSNGDLVINRVGSDQTTATALAGSQTKIGSAGTLTTTNPLTIAATSTGTYSVYTTYNPSYTPTWGYCTYARGGTECTITYFNGYNMGYTSDAGNNICFTSAGGNFCRIDMTVTSNTITKLVLRSVPTSNGDLVVQRVGADQTVATAIPGTQTKIGSAGTLTTTNPLTIAATSTGTYSVYTTYNPSYTPTWGYCTYARGGTECTITYFNGYNMGYTSDAGNNICFTSAGGNFCRIDMTVGADTITKLVTRMIPIATSNGDLVINRVGSDQTTATALAGSQTKIGSAGTLTTTNPLTIAATSTGTYSVYTTYNPSYTPTWGYCTYARGGTECTITYFNGYNMGYTSDAGNNICFTSAGGNFCRIDMTVGADTVTKLILRSVQTTAATGGNGYGDILAKRVGADLAPSSAPASQLRLDTGSVISTNPYTFIDQSTTTSHTLYTTYLSNYTTSVGNCTYARGATECAIVNFAPATCDANLGWCALPVAAVMNTVNKIVWKYDVINSAATGDLLIKRVGTDLYSTSAPAGTQSGIDGQTMIATNPNTWSAVTTGTHSTYATYNPSYITSVGYCTYARGGNECAVTNFTALGSGFASGACDNNSALCRYDVTVSANTVTKVAWKYDVNNNQQPPTFDTNSGDVRVKWVGTDLTTTTAPAGTIMKVDSFASANTNPYTYNTFSVANHRVYATYLSGYTTTMGWCTYARGATECAVTNFGSPNCDANTGFCAWDYPVSANLITKVVAKYDVITATTGDLLIKRVGTDLYSTSAPAGTQSGIDGQTMIATNPNTWSAVTTGTHSTYATYNPSYTTSYGTCTYIRGTTECAITTFTPISTGFGNGKCDTNTNLCRIDVTVSNSVVTKVAWKYDASGVDLGAVDVTISRVGADQTIGSAPAGTVAKVGVSGILTSTNPGSFVAASSSGGTVNSAYATYIPGYAVEVGYCTYARGATECGTLYPHQGYLNLGGGYAGTQLLSTIGPNYLGNEQCDTNTNLCRFDFYTYTNTVSKVVFRYTPAAQSADITIQRVGADQTTASAPSTSAKLGATGALSSTNPFTTATTSSSGGTVNSAYATYIPGYAVEVGYCTYARGATECGTLYPHQGYLNLGGGYAGTQLLSTIGPNYLGNEQCDTNTNLCRFDFYTYTNTVSKVVFRYTPAAQSADITIQRVGADQTTASAPSTSAKLGATGALSSTNPFTTATTSSSGGTVNSAYATYIPGYAVEVGYCTYARGATECGTLYPHQGYLNLGGGYAGTQLLSTIGPNYLGNEQCDTNTNLCRFDFYTYSNYVSKVVFRYTPILAQMADVTIQRTGIDQTISTAPVGTIARLGATGSFIITNPAVTSTTSSSGGTVNSAYATYIPGYAVEVGYCTYARGATECGTLYPHQGYLNLGGGYAGTQLLSTIGPNYLGNEQCDTNTNLCRFDFYTYTNTVSKVVFRYTPAAQSADVTIQRVGADQTTASAPSTSAKLGATGALSSTNPFTTATTSSSGGLVNSAYATYIPGYAVEVGYCTYARGATECGTLYPHQGYLNLGGGYAGTQLLSTIGPNYLGNEQCDTNTNLCRFDFYTYSNYVSKVVFRYTQAGAATGGNGTGDIRVKLVGGDLTTATAPTTISVHLDTGASTFTNPIVYTNQSTTTVHTVYITYNPAYLTTVGSCTYARGATECAVINFGGATCDANLGLCAVTVTPGMNYVSKIVWKFDSQNSGDLQVKRVGTDLYTSSAPAGSSVYIDTLSATSANPYIYQAVTVATHRVYAKYLSSSYTTTMGWCTYARGGTECAVTNFGSPACDINTGLCASDYPVSANIVTKVVAKYDPLPLAQNGDVQVKRVGTDLLASSSPAGTSMRVDSLDSTSTSPALYSTVLVGNHTVYATYLPGSYVTTMGWCGYARGATECAVVNFGAPNCDKNTGLCSWVYPISANTVTKVVAKYDEVTAIPFTLTNSGDLTVSPGYSVPNTITATKKSTAQTQNISFSVGGLPLGATGQFDIPSCTISCQSTLTVTTSASTPDGLYPVTVTAYPQQVVTSFTLEVTHSTATIRVCNLIKTSSGVQKTSLSGLPAGFFSIPLSRSTNLVADTFQTINFNPQSFTPNARFIDPSVNDAQCTDVSSLAFTCYKYGQQSVTGAAWQNALYNDGFTGTPNSFSGFLAYSPELFNSDPTDDVNRTMGSDGDICFNPNNHTRNLLVLNTYSASNGQVSITRVGNNGSVATVPGTTKAYLDTDSSTQNPSSFTGLNAGSYTAGVTDYSADGYTLLASMCTYTPLQTPCSATNFNITPVCDGTTCTTPITVSDGVITRVVFKYTSQNIDLTCSATSQVSQTGSTVIWKVQASPLGSYNYKWEGTDGLVCAGQPSASCFEVSKVYDSVGQKYATVSAYIDGNFVGSCSNSIKIVPTTFIEF